MDSHTSDKALLSSQNDSASTAHSEKKPQRSTGFPAEILTKIITNRELLLSQNDSASTALSEKKAPQRSTGFPAEILTKICSYLAASLFDSRAEFQLKKKARRGLSLASRECYGAVDNHRFRMLDFSYNGSRMSHGVLLKLMSRPEQARLVKELALRDTRMRYVLRTYFMQECRNHVATLAVPASLKHELMYNYEYFDPGRLTEYRILLSVASSLEVLCLDLKATTFCHGLEKFHLEVFREAARPGSTFLRHLREVHVTAAKAMSIEHLQAILQLPALKTFGCHGFVNRFARLLDLAKSYPCTSNNDLTEMAPG